MSTATTTRKPRKTVSPAERERRAQARKEQTSALQASLAGQVEAMASGEDWKKYLDFVGQFHNYSFHNALLIMVQHPTATQVAGFKQWQERGRSVRKGEKAIKIYGFATKKVTDTETGEERTKAYFPILSVFAEDQTDEITELPEWLLKSNPKARLWADVVAENPTRQLEGADDAEITNKVMDLVSDHGWTFEFESIQDSSNGYTTLDGSKRVVVDAHMSDAQTAKTSLHETAHMLLHSDPEVHSILDRATMELEAESVAYVVAGVLGMDTSGYSIGYLTGWSGGNGASVSATAERVLKAAHQILDILDPQE